MIIYKVLHRSGDGAPVSANTWGNHRVIYRPYDYVTPVRGKYGLLAFETYDRAKDFIVGHESFFEIWYADGRNVRSGRYLPPKLEWWGSDIGFTLPRYRRWPSNAVRSVLALEEEVPGGPWPSGTVMCDSIKIIRRMS